MLRYSWNIWPRRPPQKALTTYRESLGKKYDFVLREATTHRLAQVPSTLKMITKFITEVSTKFNPFNKQGRTCRSFLAHLPANARQTLKVNAIVLPRNSRDPSSLLLKFSKFLTFVREYSLDRLETYHLIWQRMEKKCNWTLERWTSRTSWRKWKGIRGYWTDRRIYWATKQIEYWNHYWLHGDKTFPNQHMCCISPTFRYKLLKDWTLVQLIMPASTICDAGLGA